MKTRVGIATAILVGGAVAAGAALAANHGAATTATAAAFSSHAGNEGTVLSSAMTNWNGSRQSSYAQLARLTQARQFSQVRHNGRTLAVQRGIVVLATKKFLILRSSNGSLHLWLLSGKTKFQNVSNSMAGTRALTASTSAARQAMGSGNMTPATSLLAGSPSTAAAMLTPTPAAQTVTVQVANTNLTVTITVTRSMATVQPDRDHAAGGHAGLEPGHVHPERLAAPRTRSPAVTWRWWPAPGRTGRCTLSWSCSLR